MSHQQAYGITTIERENERRVKMTAPYNKHADKLIVALDFDLQSEPEKGALSVFQTQQTIEMAQQLAPLGVILKIGSVVHVEGYSIISKLRELGAKVFVDLKFADIPNTMERDAWLLRNYEPDFVTAMCAIDLDGLERFYEVLESRSDSREFPRTRVVGVTVLTSLDDEECVRLHGRSLSVAVPHLAHQARLAGISHLVASPKDLGYIQKSPKLNEHFSIFTPGIRLEQDEIELDDQSRFTTPQQAFAQGADKIIVGRSIIQSQDPVATTKKYLDIIAESVNG